MPSHPDRGRRHYEEPDAWPKGAKFLIGAIIVAPSIWMLSNAFWMWVLMK